MVKQVGNNYRVFSTKSPNEILQEWKSDYPPLTSKPHKKQKRKWKLIKELGIHTEQNRKFRK